MLLSLGRTKLIRSIMVIFYQYFAKSIHFEALEAPFHTRKYPCKPLGIPGVHSFRHHQLPRAPQHGIPPGLIHIRYLPLYSQIIYNLYRMSPNHSLSYGKSREDPSTKWKSRSRSEIITHRLCSFPSVSHCPDHAGTPPYDISPRVYSFAGRRHGLFVYDEITFLIHLQARCG